MSELTEEEHELVMRSLSCLSYLRVIDKGIFNLNLTLKNLVEELIDMKEIMREEKI